MESALSTSISDNLTFLASSHGSGTIKRNLSKSAFSTGVGHFERKFQVDGDVARKFRNPSMDRYRPVDRGMMLLQLCRWKFSHKETL